MQPQLCKNCEHTFQGNFCSNCGQKTNTVRLNWHYLVDEIKYTFLHINKGFLYTAKQLFIRPGDTVREFIEGRRIQHYKPILFLFVLAGINGLLMHFFPAEDFVINTNPTNSIAATKQIEMTKKYMDFISKNYTLFELFLLPIYSLCSWLAFKKFGYNYIENIIINCFATSQRLLIGILLFPIQYLLLKTPYFIFFSFFSIIPSIGYTIWLILQLYKNQDSGKVLLRMLLFIFNIAIVFIVLLFIMIIVFVFLIKEGYLDKSIFIP
jgi:hypothetical protein